MISNLDPNKERSIKDLAKFINNRPSANEPLYCMLLGAGASVSSGIRTGQNLVQEWKKDILEKTKQEFEYSNKSDVEINKFLDEKYTWYNPANEYSSFFSKIYDLPTQRRNFIEREVSKANKPSIGYQYLNLLAPKHIETFFTTNFDDLLELSLSPQSSRERPIVCAQDSSIKNISVTSHRTKIIKLHGDFLYNDLSSSMEEIKSLKTNTKEKFAEFLKNYGLIVLGYAGNDDSIMKELNSFLETEEYLRNGIYWCLHKKDYENGLNNKYLQELLGKNRVYYVFIDGFDAFCAELAHEIYKLNDEENSITFQKSPEKQYQELDQYYTDQKEKFANNILILNDIKNSLSVSDFSENTAKKFHIQESTDELLKDKTISDTDDIDELEQNPLIKDIRKLISRNEHKQALELIDKNMENVELPSYIYNHLLSLQIKCYISLKQNDKAINVIDKAIKYNDKYKKNSNAKYYIKKSFLSKTCADKIDAIKSAIKIEPYNYLLWNRLADETDNRYIQEQAGTKQEILQYYEKSIVLNNSIDNDAYSDRIDFITRAYDKEQEIIDICDNTITLLKDNDPYSSLIFKAKLEKIKAKLKQDNQILNINQVRDIFNDFINNNNIFERNLYYIINYLKFCSTQNNIEEIEILFDKYDRMYSDTIFYIIAKAKIYLNNYKDLNLALSILENIDNNLIKYNYRNTEQYYNIYLKYLLYNKQYDKAYSIYNKNITKNMYSIMHTYLDIVFHRDKNQYLELLLNDFENSNKLTSDYISYTYGLLKLEFYDEIYDLYQEALKTQSINSNDFILKINYNMAKKFKSNSSKITKTNLDNILNFKKDNIEKAAAYILIDEIDKAEKIIQKTIDDNYSEFYYLQEMPVFKNINFDKFKQEIISVTK